MSSKVIIRGNKKYTLYRVFNNKKSAIDYASNVRGRGYYLAKVIKIDKGYGVYIHVK